MFFKQLLQYAVPSISLHNIYRGILNGFLALTCETRYAPPTNLKWYKDGLPINYDRDVYMVSQETYSLAYYDNSLVFISDDAEDMIGVFNCHTSTGRSSSTISIQGMYFNTLIHINVTITTYRIADYYKQTFHHW